jgi:hypothetical protein
LSPRLFRIGTQNDVASMSWIRGVPAEPPRQPRADELLVEAPGVGQVNLGEEAAVPIPACRLDGDHLPECERRGVLRGALAVGLPALRRVDATEPDDLGSADPEDGERVAVGDADDPGGERLRRRRPGE